MFENLIQRAKTKVRRVGAWAMEKGTQIAAGISGTIADVAEFCGNAELSANAKKRQQTFEEQNEIWRKRKEELKVQDRYEEQSGSFESPDVKLVQETTKFLDQRYDHSAKKKIKEMSPLKRTQEVETVAKGLGDIFGVNITKVNFFTPDDHNLYTCGSYDREKEEININIGPLFSDDESVLVDVISTVAHELYHARQWNAVSGKNEYGYSAEKIVIWGRNFVKYYPPQYGPLYYYQPLEADARGLENSIKDSLN